MSSPETSLIKCKKCGRETSATDVFCPSCGESFVVKKFNLIILSQEDYDAVRSSTDYWKCIYCDTINPAKQTICLNCKAVRKEAPHKTEPSASSSWPSEIRTSRKKSTIVKNINAAFGNIFSTGMSFFKELPKNYQIAVIGILMALLGWAVPWSAFGMDFIGSVLILGGIVLVLAGSGLLKPIKKKAGELATS